MAEKILVTGGAGFIGCNLAAKLLARGDEVLIFDNLHPQVHSETGLPRRLPKGAQFLPGDVAVASNWQTLFKVHRPDVVIHLAAETGTGQSLTEAHRHASVNVSGTALLMDALTTAKHVPRRLLLSSSRAVYGDGAWKDSDGQVFYPPGRSRDDLEKRQWNFLGPRGSAAAALPHEAGRTHPNPTSVYGATKLTQESMLAAWSRAFGAGLTVLRLQNVYGPGQAVNNPYTGVLTFFARRAKEGGVLDVYEDGEIVRDFVHVDDVTNAMVAALNGQDTQVHTYDIGSGSPTTIHAVARKLSALFKAPEPVISGKFRDGDVRAASCSIAAARAELRYQPSVSLDEGLATLARSIGETR